MFFTSFKPTISGLTTSTFIAAEKKAIAQCLDWMTVSEVEGHLRREQRCRVPTTELHLLRRDSRLSPSLFLLDGRWEGHDLRRLPREYQAKQHQDTWAHIMLALAMSMKVDNRIICFLSGLTLLELGTCKAIKHLLAVPAPNSLRGRTIRGRARSCWAAGWEGWGLHWSSRGCF